LQDRIKQMAGRIAQLEEKVLYYKKFDDREEEYLRELNELKEENQKYLNNIIRNSKEKAALIAPSQYVNDFDSQSTIENQKVNSDKLFEARILRKSHWQTTHKGTLHAPIGKKTSRQLTLNQMKEVIHELYESKLKYDKMYLDSNLPRETMEQHMYTYLNQKYGLKVHLPFH